MENIKYRMDDIVGYRWFVGYNNLNDSAFAKNILLFGDERFIQKIIPTMTYGQAYAKYCIIRHVWSHLIRDIYGPFLLSDYVYCSKHHVFIPKKGTEETAPMPHGLFFSLT